MSARLLYEAYSTARAVEVSCGPSPELEEAISIIEELLNTAPDPDALTEAAILLRQAADRARMQGCLDWHLLDQAADTLEHTY